MRPSLCALHYAPFIMRPLHIYCRIAMQSWQCDDKCATSCNSFLLSSLMIGFSILVLTSLSVSTYALFLEQEMQNFFYLVFILLALGIAGYSISYTNFTPVIVYGILTLRYNLLGILGILGIQISLPYSVPFPHFFQNLR